MKTIKFKYLLLLLIVPGITFAEGIKGKYTKEKKINRAFSVSNNAGLDVYNKYGNVYVTTWDQDRTEIDVVIKVSGNNEDKVNRRLNTINVAFESTKSMVIAKTLIENFSANNISMEINYTIKIPKQGSLKLSNSYGSTVLGEINGKADITCKYGSLKLEALNSNSNSVNLKYCDSNKLGFINQGTVDAGYSDVTLTRSNNLKLQSDYSNIKIGEVGDIMVRSDYGDVSILKGGVIAGTGRYLNFKFGSVSELLNITADYGNVNVSSIKKSLKNVAITASYTNIDLNYEAGFNFDFEVTLRYSDLSGSNLNFSTKNEKNTSAYYKGNNGKSGQARVYVKSEYGNVTLEQL
ncbi:MAG: hypothetical protein EOO45_20435 [Flavobacterium sp.]|nr:MAG: hypothetical protein EOO45_20435 [Flavobacterium sp.]